VISPDALSLESIRQRLRTRTIGSHLVFHAEVDSTNRAAMALAEGKTAHGTVVVADAQTQGRGRLGRAWLSPPGMNLYFSVVLDRDATLPPITWLPLLVSLAVLRAVKSISGLASRLKWPNDVISDRTLPPRKLAGVLAEATDHTVVFGVGVNVNMASDALPIPLRPIATSILIETGRWMDRSELLAQILLEAEQLCDPAIHFLDNGMEAYRNACSTLGKAVKVVLTGGGDVEGLAVAIAADGALCVRKADSSIIEIRAGDVVHLR
jgi:BirA family transcriptional regulator, biotin operon repressor / biotin---[acetyl-CoA-carboxylase] ligase